MASATSFYDFKPLDRDGKEWDLSQYKGKVVLVVNTASKCGFTPQYEGLQKLFREIKDKDEYKEYKDKFEVIGFPCNQFMNQEPGDASTIDVCLRNYGVDFKILGKTDVNGENATPVYEWMKNEKPGLLGIKKVKWNFEKFLIGADGKVKNRWASTTTPEAIKPAVLEELKKA